MAIRVDRIRADIKAIARCTEAPGHGATRATFSKAWADARAYVIDQAQAAGCTVTTDAAGNAHARPASLPPDAPAYLCGSHLDTVPHGGDYDGVAGVSVALELLRSAKDDGVTIPAVELIVFAEEEGPTFGLGMIGSRAWVGELSAEQLANLRNAAGQTYLEAGKPYGVDSARLATDRLDPARYLGLIEVHIEQGPGMWRRDHRLAVVRAIAGRRQYRVTVIGEANHAGATSMTDRRDALAAAAEMLVALEHLPRVLSPDAVLTVGRLANAPNAVNVIPDRVEFTIDLRSGDDAALARGDGEIRATISTVASTRSVKTSIEQTEAIAARPMDSTLVGRLVEASGNASTVVSGALHDSAVLAPHVPTVMLFVPSRDGISHNPAEFSRVEDIAAAAEVVQRVVRRPTVAQLNAMPREAFVAVCGRFFEHSPWLAERTLQAGRPFASRADLHEKLCATLAKATDDEKLTLIRAHPDLVGRLAREGRLTRESAGEQAAAGLDALSESEVTAFEGYNAQYRERFGFPFVICARQNRKDAILAAFPRRLKNTQQQEIATALCEIEQIARLRLMDATWD